MEDEAEVLESKQLLADLQKKAEFLMPSCSKTSFETPTIEFIRTAMNLPAQALSESPKPFLLAKSLKGITYCY